MKAKLLTFLLAILAVLPAFGQDTYYTIFSYSHFIPRVRVNDHAVALQADLFPRVYKSRSVVRDMRWVANNDTAIVAFWQSKGDTVLHMLREFSGIKWHETEFDIYLVRYFPSLGSSDPLIIPVGGIYQGTLVEAAPGGSRLILNLVYQLAKRMLAQAYQPEDSVCLSIADHPLMRPGPYRLDNLAMLLALTTCQNIIGVEAAYDAFESAFWKKQTLGRVIFKRYLANSWILSPEHTLADWIAAEPHSSKLVLATRPPRKREHDQRHKVRKFVEGLPLKGQLGFSTKISDRNQLVVDQIDAYRLAYACGLRSDDIVRRVDGRLVKNHKQLVEYILESLEAGGATVQIIRDGRMEQVLIQPMDVSFSAEDYVPGEYWEPDSLTNDSAGGEQQDF